MVLINLYCNLTTSKLLYLSHIRGLAFGIYETNNPEACQFAAHDCKANMLVVENQKQLDKILQVGLIDYISSLNDLLRLNYVLACPGA